MNYEAMKKELAKRLTKKRYEHSLGVAKTAAMLAERFDVNIEKARIAGLLHDCAREYDIAELKQEAARHLIPYGEVERAMPLLLHAYVGAKRAEEIYAIRDSEIKQAIWCHSVGARHMTKLDKIIYFADMIEPGRNYPEVFALRELARTATLDEMLFVGLSKSIEFILTTKKLLHPATVIARNELLLSLSKQKRPLP